MGSFKLSSLDKDIRPLVNKALDKGFHLELGGKHIHLVKGNKKLIFSYGKQSRYGVNLLKRNLSKEGVL